MVVPANGQASAVITIVASPDNRRQVTFEFNVWLNDDDFGDSDECGVWGNLGGHDECEQHPTPILAQCNIDPVQRIDTVKVFDECVGAEVRGTIEVQCSFAPNPDNPAIQRDVRTLVTLRLFEGTSCNGDEVGGSLGHDDGIPAGGTLVQSFFISDESFPTNGAPFDRIEVSYTATNTVQP